MKIENLSNFSPQKNFLKVAKLNFIRLRKFMPMVVVIVIFGRFFGTRIFCQLMKINKKGLALLFFPTARMKIFARK